MDGGSVSKGIEYNFKKVFCIPCGKFKTVPIDAERCPVCATKFECSVVEYVVRNKVV